MKREEGRNKAGVATVKGMEKPEIGQSGKNGEVGGRIRQERRQI